MMNWGTLPTWRHLFVNWAMKDALFKYYSKSATSPQFIKVYTEELAIKLQTIASGGAQPFVSLGELRKLVIALPPLAEQDRIVTKVDELMNLCDQLKTRLNTAKITQLHHPL